MLIPKARRKSALQTNDLVSDTIQSTGDKRPGRNCHAVIEEADEQPTVCTIYSTEPADSIVTTWVSAEEGGYYKLEEIR